MMMRCILRLQKAKINESGRVRCHVFWGHSYFAKSQLSLCGGGNREGGEQGIKQIPSKQKGKFRSLWAVQRSHVGL